MTKLSLFTFAIAAAAFPTVAQADTDPTPAPQPPVTDLPPEGLPPATVAPAPMPAEVDTTVIVTPADPTPPPPPVVETIATPVVYTPVMTDDLSMTSYAWSERRLQSGIGIAASIGGGVSGFTDRQMRDTVSSNVSGLWDARVTIGSHIPIGVDVSYIGTAANLNSLSGTQSATLVGTTTEAALRWNILPHAYVNPYIFAGAGWQRYDVTGRTVSLSDSGMRQSDNSIEFPMGAGLSFRDRSGFLVEARGTFRANIDQGLVLANGTNPNAINNEGYAPMHTWEASAAVGYEF